MELRVNLKICEACGCLWYRSCLETRVYCTGCSERFREFPTRQNRKRPGRPRKTTLPTVFAVQTSAEFDWASQGLSTGETPVALLASQAAAFASSATHLGGAQ
jgi:hypothetical protein